MAAPIAYYTLSESAGSPVASDSSGNQATALTPAGSGTGVVFGNATGPLGGGSLTAATFAGGKYLIRTVDPSLTTYTLRFSFATLSANHALGCVDAGANAILIQSGDIQFAGFLFGTDVNDGLWHDVAIVVGGGTADLYLDGALGANDVAVGSVPLTTLRIGGHPVSTGLTGSIAHVAIFDSALSPTRIADHASAALTGFAGESGTARIARICRYAGIPVGTLDPSLTDMPPAC
jgi:Concanavalin A-like lectin/glucanases superfamily